MGGNIQKEVKIYQPSSIVNKNSTSFNISTTILNDKKVTIEGIQQAQIIIIGQVKVFDESKKYIVKGYQFLNETHNAVVEDEDMQESYRGNLVNFLYDGYGCLVDKMKNIEYRGYFSQGKQIGYCQMIDLGKKEGIKNESELESFLQQYGNLREQTQNNYFTALVEPITKYLDVLNNIKDDNQMKSNSSNNLKKGFKVLERLYNFVNNEIKSQLFIDQDQQKKVINNQLKNQKIQTCSCQQLIIRQEKEQLEQQLQKVKDQLKIFQDKQSETDKEKVKLLNQLEQQKNESKILTDNRIKLAQEELLKQFEQSKIETKILTDKQIKEANELLKQSKNEISSLTDKQSKVEKAKEELLNQLEQRENDIQILIDRLEKEKQELQNQVEQQAKQINILIHEKSKVEQEKEELQQQLEQSKNEIKILISSVSALNDSKILQTDEEKYHFINLNELFVGKQIKLIYNASENEFSADSFHSKCNGQANTIILIKSQHNKVFGAFTTQSWESSDRYKSDSNAYIFSITNNKKFKIKQHQNAVYYNRIYLDNNNGKVLAFGIGPDIFLCDNSRINDYNNQSYSNLGKSYDSSPYQYESQEAKSILAGSNYFKVVHIEVFMLF